MKWKWCKAQGFPHHIKIYFNKTFKPRARSREREEQVQSIGRSSGEGRCRQNR